MFKLFTPVSVSIYELAALATAVAISALMKEKNEFLSKQAGHASESF